MKEAGATTGNDGSKYIIPILKGVESPKAGAGAEAGLQEEKVRFADASPALSNEEKTLIKDFSTAFNLKEGRMTEIFQNSKTPEGIKDIDKAYLLTEGEKNPKFKESGFFKGLLPENDKKVENGPGNSAVTDNVLGEDPFNKRRLNSGGQEKGGGEEKKGDNKKLMLALGLLFIACIFLATGGAALPLIGGAIAASQGLFIALAVGAGVAGIGFLIKDKFDQGSNKVGPEVSEGRGAQGQGQGQGQAQENAQAPAQAQVQTPAQAQAQAQAPAPAPALEKAQAPAPEKAQAPAQVQTQEKAQAPAPDLMKLMKQDLQAHEKDILKGFKKELDENPKLSSIIFNNTSTSEDYKTESQNLSPDDLNKLSALPIDTKEKLSMVGQAEPGEAINKLPKNVSKDIGIDSKSEKRTLEALNLEDTKLKSKMSNRLEHPSGTWANRVVQTQSQSRGGFNEV